MVFIELDYTKDIFCHFSQKEKQVKYYIILMKNAT